ncbi:hypothetical protein RSOLAG1IB_07582 [Rhizoctonia solani AG-1 IB]|uniref:Uncharacterized protein n=1 Tax=Thanatephorus cucumeris (strain AG1-IB / isolate 7/3/14) TaxID=1108050 RepID=A0A0B7FGV5_THACB|nr:hypothetical protein RSOLAG1IB_07582 [Rhizoctonia solani AG-1 IB]
MQTMVDRTGPSSKKLTRGPPNSSPPYRTIYTASMHIHTRCRHGRDQSRHLPRHTLHVTPIHHIVYSPYSSGALPWGSRARTTQPPLYSNRGNEVANSLHKCRSQVGLKFASCSWDHLGNDNLSLSMALP